MVVRPSDLRAIPLFQDITDDHLGELMGAFERLAVEPGHVLFEAGSPPSHLFVLVSGAVELREGAEVKFVLAPIAPIGELGAVTGLARSTTAVATAQSEVWRIAQGALMDFFERHGDVAFPFYHNLLGIVADKVRRDGQRQSEMRANLIRTQKSMKRLLDHVLEAEETPLSKTVAETLEDLIEHNKRGHYLVEPARNLACVVRLDGGAVVPVLAMSDTTLRLGKLPVDVGRDSASAGRSITPPSSAHWSGVLVLPSREIPVSGAIKADGDGAVVTLDLLIDDYAAALREYLTRLQMLDFVV